MALVIYFGLVTLGLAYFGTVTYFLVQAGKRKEQNKNLSKTVESVGVKNEVSRSVDALNRDAVSARLHRRWERNA
jgi:hypothetical protein